MIQKIKEVQYIPAETSENASSSLFVNNKTITDGGVAPRHLLRLDWDKRKDLKGQKKM